MNLAGTRLTSVTNPSYTAAYTYAADGLRLRVQESNAQYTDRWLQPLGPFGAGVAAQRVQPYDGVRPVLEGTLNGDVYTTTAKYVWEGDSYYSPLVYSMLGGTWRYHLYDGLGSTRHLILHASPYTVTDTYSYEAFGNLMASTGTTPNLARSRPPVGGRDRHGGAAGPHLATYRYVGSLGYYQTGNSLMHLGARYYMPEIGRFLSQDPRRDDAHQYTYTGNSPVGGVDPSGLITIKLPKLRLPKLGPGGWGGIAKLLAKLFGLGVAAGCSAVSLGEFGFGDCGVNITKREVLDCVCERLEYAFDEAYHPSIPGMGGGGIQDRLAMEACFGAFYRTVCKCPAD